MSLWGRFWGDRPAFKPDDIPVIHSTNRSTNTVHSHLLLQLRLPAEESIPEQTRRTGTGICTIYTAFTKLLNNKADKFSLTDFNLWNYTTLCLKKVYNSTTIEILTVWFCPIPVIFGINVRVNMPLKYRLRSHITCIVYISYLGKLWEHENYKSAVKKHLSENT